MLNDAHKKKIYLLKILTHFNLKVESKNLSNLKLFTPLEATSAIVN